MWQLMAGSNAGGADAVRQPCFLRAATCLLLALSGIIWQQQALGAQPSSLSRWLSREAAPELGQLLSRHPRYAGQRVIPGRPGNALEEAVITVLRNRLAREQGIVLPEQGEPPVIPTTARSIDALDCSGGQRAEYLLRVSAFADSGGRDRLRLDLVETGGDGQIAHSWQWSGSFSGAERRHMRKDVAAWSADGSLAAPWTGDDVDSAARALSRDLACALRPQLAERIDLRWPARSALPPLFADTANATRHLLGGLNGIDTAGEDPGMDIELRLERFRDDVWQLWLVGTPRLPELAPVQAVAYFHQAGLTWPPPEPARAPARVPARVPAKVPALPGPEITGDPLDYLDVQLLDATQADLAGPRADLQVTLRIANRGAWPIAYSFTLSGGHFNHCIAEPAYYRHDRYGRLAGSLEPGGSVVRRLTVERARHRPTPLFGVRKCAGFRDLDGFEAFTSRGYKVTDFVRWDM